SVAPPKLAATRLMPGACTTCTATPSSGAVIGITANCRAALIRIYVGQRPVQRRVNTEISPVFAEVVAGRTKAGPAALLFGCDSSRSVATTTSAFASLQFS